MEKDDELLKRGKVTRIESEDSSPKVGQWYWVTYQGHDDHWKKRTFTPLMCLMRLGSNYAKFAGLPEDSEYDRWSGIRIHFNEFAKSCRFEPDPEGVIKGQIELHRRRVVALMDEVRQVTAALGVSQRALPAEETQALVRASAVPLKQYRQALEKAKDKTLPELFERIGSENKMQARWMKATLLPMKAQIGKLEPIVKAIKARIFNVELYAGLSEEVAEIRSGKRAAAHERVRLFQRRHYMDEESLVAYEIGGMDYGSIEDFDAWLSKPENADRILPFQRCIVAFRVRRTEKERDADDYGGGIGAHIAIAYEMAQDKRTFLYMRNGERIYRLSTAIEFGYRMFPDLDARDLGGGGTYWATDRWHHDEEDLDGERMKWHVVNEAQFEGIKQRDAERRAEQDRRWEQDQERARAKNEKAPHDPPSGKAYKKGDFPFYSYDDKAPHYFRVTKESVYYDDIMKQIEDMAAKHNRLAIVLQGLLDRSEVFQPHPKWELWTPDGFEQAIELVYDHDRALTSGEAPDFDAYWKRLGASLTAGSVTIGQDDHWQRRMADVENERYKGYRPGQRDTHHSHFQPDGDPGPGDLARIVRIGKHGALFKWERERRNQWRLPHWRRRDTALNRQHWTPLEKLFNVDAYKTGDFRQFYADPRTRAKYLKWAPFLLEAEEYHAGNRPLGDDAKWYNSERKERSSSRRRRR